MNEQMNEMNENINQQENVDKNETESVSENKENKIKEKKSMFHEFLEFGICLVIAVVSAYLIVTFVAQRTNVDGKSMYPYLDDGESLIVEKLSYKFGDVDRFDIVVFPHYDEERGGEVYYIKRVIGMPGETVQIKDGKIYINGEVLDEDYGYYINDYPMSGYDAEEEIEIGEDEYFVMGDNSRQIGCVKGDTIVGRACFRILPFKRMGVLD